MQFQLSFADFETGKITVSGHVKDASNGESLIGASVYISELKTGSIINAYGFYSLSVAPGKYTIFFSYVGYSGTMQTIELKNNVTIKAELKPESKELQEVVIKGEKANITGMNPKALRR